MITNVADILTAVRLSDVINQFVSLDKNHKACCPFHDEKTPSFSVSDKLNIYNCFGCHESGNAISFLMAHQNFEFIKAVEWLSQFTNIPIETTQVSDEAKAKIEKAKDKKNKAVILLKACNKQYVKELYNNKNALNYWTQRGFTNETLNTFQIGLAPNSWNFLTPKIIETGNFEVAGEIGLVRTNNNKNYDFFRNRTTIPIHNDYGNIVAFAARTLTKEKEAAKYINSETSFIYNKDKTLYNLHRAIPHIKKQGFVYLTEGYTDVMALWQMGICNAVATCGTALTLGHCALLQRYTNNVTIFRDGDSAGVKACIKDVDTLITNGFTTCVAPLDVGDPAEFALSYIETPDNLLPDLKAKEKAAILWKANHLSTQSNSDEDKGRYFNELLQLVSYIKSEYAQEKYAGEIAKIFKVRKGLVVDQLKKYTTVEVDEAVNLNGVIVELNLTPEQQKDAAEFLVYKSEQAGEIGFYVVDWVDGKPKTNRATNFTLNPIMHIVRSKDSERVIEIKSERFKGVFTLPNKALTSQQTMFETLTNLAACYFTDVRVTTYRKICKYIMEKCKRAFPINTLGWQPEGFYAFADGLHTGKEFIPIDNNGVLVYKNENYFLPAFSAITENLREETDFESIKNFKFYNNNLNVNPFLKLMAEVYQDNNNGIIAISFLISSMFRSHIFKQQKSFPLMYCQGEKSSGKSQLAHTLNSVFSKDAPFFNLNSGTNVAFYRKTSEARNTIVIFDEYENNIDPKRFQGLKSIYDGAGHTKGIASADNRTMVTNVNATCCFLGQYAPTRDDNSLYTRSLVLEFMLKESRTAEEIKCFNEMVTIQNKGLSEIIPFVIKHWKLITTNYTEEYRNTYKELKGLSFKGKHLYDRLLINYATVLTPVLILLDNDLISPDIFIKTDSKGQLLRANNKDEAALILLQIAAEKIINQDSQITSSDALTRFFDILEMLKNEQKLKANVHFKFLESDEVAIYMKAAHLLYAEKCARLGENALDIATIKNYLKNKSYCIDINRNVRLKATTDFTGSKSTRCFVFNYPALNIDLDEIHLSS